MEGREVLPVSRQEEEEEEEVAVLAVIALAVAAWLQQRRRWAARRKRYRTPYEYNLSSFSLELMPPGKARFWLRFTPGQIRQLVPLLGLDGVPYRRRYKADGELALCIVAARLSFPGRWCHLSDLFGRSSSWLSTVFNDTVLFLAARFGPLLWWHPQLTYSRLLVFAEAVNNLCGVDGIWGFVDGTFRGHRRPQDYEAQRSVYSGHKKAHGIKYQAVVTPDGLVSSLTGPWMGPVNDWAMWQRSGIESAIREVLKDHEPLYLFGDPAYRASFGVACPFEDPRGRGFLPDNKAAFNTALSSVRIAVEQAFGRTQVLWTYTAFSKGLTAGQQPIAAHFFIAVLLSNCYTCFYGSPAGNRFLVPPLSIEAYLRLQ